MCYCDRLNAEAAMRIQLSFIARYKRDCKNVNNITLFTISFQFEKYRFFAQKYII